MRKIIGRCILCPATKSAYWSFLFGGYCSEHRVTKCVVVIQTDAQREEARENWPLIAVEEEAGK